MNETIWIVPADHPALAGHFPGRPIVPGVVLLDRVIGLIAASHGQTASRCHIANAKFLSPAGPGETLTFSWQARASGAIDFAIACAERAVASGLVTFPKAS